MVAFTSCYSAQNEQRKNGSFRTLLADVRNFPFFTRRNPRIIYNDYLYPFSTFEKAIQYLVDEQTEMWLFVLVRTSRMEYELLSVLLPLTLHHLHPLRLLCTLTRSGLPDSYPSMTNDPSAARLLVSQAESRWISVKEGLSTPLVRRCLY